MRPALLSQRTGWRLPPAALRGEGREGGGRPRAAGPPTPGPASTSSAPSTPPPPTAPPAASPVDYRRLYDQLVTAQARLAGRLSARTRSANAARRAADERGAALAAAAAALSDAAADLASCAEAAKTGAAVTAFAVSGGADGASRLAALAAKLEGATVRLEAAAATAKASAPVRVSLTLEAVGSHVSLHGCWDGWSEEGVILAPTGPAGSGGPALFSGSLSLPPGVYRAKLRVDGAWRPVPGWESRVEDDGVENSVLRVE